MHRTLILLIPLGLIAQNTDTINAITPEHLLQFEKARADEMESAALHNADVQLLNAAVNDMVRDCAKAGAVVYKQDRMEVTCKLKPSGPSGGK
jgi:hypothetical protein